MTTTTFATGTLITSSWLNDVDFLVYDIFNGLTSVPSSGKILRSNGTHIAATTSTFADTYSASTLLYANGANTVTGLATANSATLQTNGSGVPSWIANSTALSNMGGVPAGPITSSGLTQSTAKLLGRTTASTGAIEEISVGSGLSLAATTLSSVISATQTFLGSNNVLGDSAYHDIVNTGSIGAAGQTWLIIATSVCADANQAANFLQRIWDGTTVYNEVSNLSVTASGQITTTTCAVVTLAAAATFRLSIKDLSATTGTVYTTGNSGTANKATSITAIRLI